MKIAILGFGNVGKQFAALFSQAGYEIVLGLRLAPDQELPYVSTSFKEAAEAADCIALAIPFTACLNILPDLAEATRGKVIIDSTNPLNAYSPDFGRHSHLTSAVKSHLTSAG